MNRLEWLEEVAKNCEFAEVVEGGAMCKESMRREYCSFRRCPKCEMELKEGYIMKRKHD